jgi:hypothetical protein
MLKDFAEILQCGEGFKDEWGMAKQKVFQPFKAEGFWCLQYKTI